MQNEAEGKRMEMVEMPDLGESVQEGKILCWRKLVGDTINRGDPLVEIETDKANVYLESFHFGVLRAILVSAGETVPIGTALALIGTADEPLPDSLPRQPVIVTQRCSDRTLDRANQQKQPSLLSMGQQSGWIALLILSFVFLHPDNLLATIVVGIFIAGFGFFLGLSFQRWRSTRQSKKDNL